MKRREQIPAVLVVAALLAQLAVPAADLPVPRPNGKPADMTKKVKIRFLAVMAAGLGTASAALNKAEPGIQLTEAGKPLETKSAATLTGLQAEINTVNYTIPADANKPKPAGEESVASGVGAAIPRETHDISGWQVHLSKKLLEAEPDAAARALTGLKKMLDEIGRVVPASAVTELRKVPLYFSSAYKAGRSGAEFHPDAGWLRDNGRDPAMARGVEFSGVDGFEAEMRRMPNFALHELAHAYHFRALKSGFDNADIKAAYECAKASGSYDRVERSFGEGNGTPNTFERAYAMTNPMEYFAETTEAYFSRNDFFPFTREQLKKHDPAMFTLLGALWGVPEATLTQAESRLRAIDDRDEFRPKSVRADWPADSSGYLVLESAPDAQAKVRGRYDVASGKRTVMGTRKPSRTTRDAALRPFGENLDALLEARKQAFLQTPDGGSPPADLAAAIGRFEARDRELRALVSRSGTASGEKPAP